MASEKTEKKTTATKSTAKKPAASSKKTTSTAAKKPAAKTASKPAAKKPTAEKVKSTPAVEKTAKPDAAVESAACESSDKRIELLMQEIEKLKGELNIIKQFKNNASEKNISEKIFAELEKIREQLFNCEDRLDELEYVVSEKEDY